LGDAKVLREACPEQLQGNQEVAEEHQNVHQLQQPGKAQLLRSLGEREPVDLA
jgi:hypothetical protein